MTLCEQAEAVENEKDFLQFVRALAADRRVADQPLATTPTQPDWQSVGWQNDNIADFLESAIGWAEDSDFGALQDLRDANSWKKVAIFLYCGKIYE